MKKKIISILESLCEMSQEDKNESKIKFTQEQIVCTSSTIGSIGGLIFGVLMTIPSIYLWQLAGSILSKLLAVIWLLIFLRLMFDFLKSELRLKASIPSRTFQIENINFLVVNMRIMAPNFMIKSLNFSEIKELVMQQTNRYRYWKEDTQILAVTNNDSKILLVEFRNEFVAKRFIFVLREIVKA